MGLGEGMRALDQADDLLHRAGKDVLPDMESGLVPPHLYMEILRLREELRDLEARFGEHVMSISEATDHA